MSTNPNMLPLETFRNLLASSSTLSYLRDVFFTFEPKNGKLTVGQNDLLRRAVNESRWAPEVIDFIEGHLKSHGIVLLEDFEIYFWRNSDLEYSLQKALDQLTQKLGMSGYVTWDEVPHLMGGLNYKRSGASDPIGDYVWSNAALKGAAQRHPEWVVGDIYVDLGIGPDPTRKIELDIGLFEQQRTDHTTILTLETRLELFNSRYTSLSDWADTVKKLTAFIKALA